MAIELRELGLCEGLDRGDIPYVYVLLCHSTFQILSFYKAPRRQANLPLSLSLVYSTCIVQDGGSRIVCPKQVLQGIQPTIGTLLSGLRLRLMSIGINLPGLFHLPTVSNTVI